MYDFFLLNKTKEYILKNILVTKQHRTPVTFSVWKQNQTFLEIAYIGFHRRKSNVITEFIFLGELYMSWYKLRGQNYTIKYNLDQIKGIVSTFKLCKHYINLKKKEYFKNQNCKYCPTKTSDVQICCFSGHGKKIKYCVAQVDKHLFAKPNDKH